MDLLLMNVDITHPCSLFTLLSQYVSVIHVPLWLPFLLPFTLYHKAAIPGAGSTQALIVC
jgi:hypothetical protein